MAFGGSFWKWLNISSKDSDFSADEGDTTESEFEFEEMCNWERRLCEEERRLGGLGAEANGNQMEDIHENRFRRRMSETLRAQYIDVKELRICVGTWNVGGKLPPDDLNIEEWLDVDEPADIYVLGFMENTTIWTAMAIFKGCFDGSWIYWKEVPPQVKEGYRKKFLESYNSCLSQKFGEEVTSQPSFEDKESWLYATGGIKKGRALGYGNKVKAKKVFQSACSASSSCGTYPSSQRTSSHMQWTDEMEQMFNQRVNERVEEVHT